MSIYLLKLKCEKQLLYICVNCQEVLVKMIKYIYACAEFVVVQVNSVSVYSNILAYSLLRQRIRHKAYAPHVCIPVDCLNAFMASTIWPTPPSTAMSPHLSSVQNYHGNITFQHMICSPSTVMLANPLIAHSNTELSLLWLLITSEMSPITPASASLPVSDGTRSNN